MSRRRPHPQAELFAKPLDQGATERERETLWARVRFLRNAGWKVSRVGSTQHRLLWHAADDHRARILTDVELFKFAKREGFRTLAQAIAPKITFKKGPESNERLVPSDARRADRVRRAGDKNARGDISQMDLL